MNRSNLLLTLALATCARIFNAGLHGGKGTPYQGGTRAAAFFRWPAGGIPAGTECDALSAHIDIFPTLAELAGAKLSEEVKSQHLPSHGA